MAVLDFRTGTISLTTGPAAEPISTADAKTHLRVTASADDTYIDALVQAAREKVEADTWRALINQTWVYRLDAFPPHGDPIELPRAPLSSVTSVGYIDLAGTAQVWASTEYQVDTPGGDHAQPGMIIPRDSANLRTDYPTDVLNDTNVVTVTFVAGYGATAADVPQSLIQAMLLLLGHWYDNRTAVTTGTNASDTPMAYEPLIAPFRVGRW